MPFKVEQIRLAQCDTFPLGASTAFESLDNALTYIKGEIDGISSNLPEVTDINRDEILYFSLPKRTDLETYLQYQPTSTTFSLSTVDEELFQIFISYDIQRNSWTMIEYAVESSDSHIEEIEEWLKEIRMLLILNSDYTIQSICKAT